MRQIPIFSTKNGAVFSEKQRFFTFFVYSLTQQYQASLRQHNCRSLVELAMSIHAKRRQAESQNRRLGMVDERYLKQAEQLLFGELAASLEIPYEAVQPYIADRIAAVHS